MAIKAADLLQRLTKAQQVGILEDRFTIQGVEVVIRNLTATQHEAVTQEVSEVPEDQYMVATQLAQLSRAIVEIDGVDLRDAIMIEGEPRQEGGKPIFPSVERHAWVRVNLLSHWGREAIFTAWRKLAELFVKAESATLEGIQFDITNESPEDKVRRLLTEASEASQELPDPMIEHIWGEFGWMPKTSEEELEAVAARAREWQAEQLAKKAEAEMATSVQQAEPPSEPEPPSESKAPPVPVEQLLANRQPLNREAVAPVRPEAMQGRRAAYQADAQALQDLGVAPAEMGTTPQTAYNLASGPAELRRPAAALDQAAVAVDAPAVGGINPRFKPRR